MIGGIFELLALIKSKNAPSNISEQCMPLSDLAIRSAKPAERPFKLSDSGGLYVEVMPSGSKLWRLKYRFAKKEKRLSFGAYPVVSLRDARDRRDAAKRLLSEGRDPSAEKRAEKVRLAVAAATTFEAVAREWHERMRLGGWSDGHAKKVLQRLKNDVFPWVGSRPVSEISASELLAVLRRIERRSLETAHKAKDSSGQIFRYAIATGRAERNPVPDLRGALPPVRNQHFAAPTDPRRVGELLRMLEAFDGSFVVAIALKLSPLFFARPGELRMMRWRELDFDRNEWCYIATKSKSAHVVPLSRQALMLLSELRPLTGSGLYVFPGGRDPRRPMSDGAMNAALKRLGIDSQEELTPHGWRATARTLLHERLGFAPEAIELQLAHAVPDMLGRAYNRTKFLAERRRMMQAWADYLDVLKSGC